MYMLRNQQLTHGWCLLSMFGIPQTAHARMLASSKMPSTNDIATVNIVVFVSIGLVLISYFSMMALANIVRARPGACPRPAWLGGCAPACWLRPWYRPAWSPRPCSPRVLACAQEYMNDSLLYSKSKTD